MTSSYLVMTILMTLALFASIDTAAGTGISLSSDFYHLSCPKVFTTVRPIVETAIKENPRMGACLLRLFFHDCFVQGCDASILLDDIPPVFYGEKNVYPNKDSACGFEVIDQIKIALEYVCPGLVSCADIVATAARDAVGILGGPRWEVQLGRKDAKVTNPHIANISIPTSKASLNELIFRFRAVGLNKRDLVALSGAHTLGHAQCINFRKRIYNETNINPAFAKQRRAKCPRRSGSGDTNKAPIDASTPIKFDNSYFKNLVQMKGLLHSDQQLFNGGQTHDIVRTYNVSQESFFMDFVSAMIKMGSLNPLFGPAGEIRINCRRINPLY